MHTSSWRDLATAGLKTIAALLGGEPARPYMHRTFPWRRG